jgi:hypothetical protein
MAAVAANVGGRERLQKGALLPQLVIGPMAQNISTMRLRNCSGRARKGAPSSAAKVYNHQFSKLSSFPANSD